MAAGARDLLRRFSGGFSPENVTCGDSGEIELGLSLGGCFSPQESENSRLIRSSSIPDMLQNDFPTVGTLLRTCSLPCVGEEEIRRRKEVLSVKRIEAKKKREVRSSMKGFDGEFEGGSVGKMRRFEGSENGVESCSRRFEMGSQGSSSSGGSEFESRAGQGFEFPRIICASEVSTTANATTSSSKHNNHKVSLVSTSPATPTSKSIDNTVLRRGVMFNENVLRKNEGEGFLNGGISDVGKKIMEDMPSVSTKGDGPNGKRIDGFLYRYGKGEVSIVCVCHGSFLTPAEFVKHGGGGDVSHPLRHIVVNPGFL